MSQLNSISFNKYPFTPSKLVCVGRNYLDHIAELGNQVPVSPLYLLNQIQLLATNSASITTTICTMKVSSAL